MQNENNDEYICKTLHVVVNSYINDTRPVETF